MTDRDDRLPIVYFAALERDPVHRASYLDEACGEDEDLKSQLEEMLAAKQSPFPRAEAFSVHELIDPRETRPMLCRWIDRVQPLLPNLLGPSGFSVRP